MTRKSRAGSGLIGRILDLPVVAVEALATLAQSTIIS